MRAMRPHQKPGGGLGGSQAQPVRTRLTGASAFSKNDLAVIRLHRQAYRLRLVSRTTKSPKPQDVLPANGHRPHSEIRDQALDTPEAPRASTKVPARAAVASVLHLDPYLMRVDLPSSVAVAARGMDSFQPAAMFTILRREFSVCGRVRRVLAPGEAVLAYAQSPSSILLAWSDAVVASSDLPGSGGQDLRQPGRSAPHPSLYLIEFISGWEAVGDDSTTIFIKGLNANMSEMSLRSGLMEAFEVYGNIRQIRLPMDSKRRPKGIAYIVFDDGEAKVRMRFIVFFRWGIASTVFDDGEAKGIAFIVFDNEEAKQKSAVMDGALVLGRRINLDMDPGGGSMSLPPGKARPQAAAKGRRTAVPFIHTSSITARFIHATTTTTHQPIPPSTTLED
eukprot:gene21185-28085_t